MIGIVPGWGGAKRMPPLIGAAAALDLMLTGRTVVWTSTATGVATGAGMSVAMHAALGGIHQLVVAPNERLPLGHPDNPLVGRAMTGEFGALRMIVQRMERWEVGIADLQSELAHH